MSLTRRKFLSAGAYAALLASIPLASLEQVFAQESKPTFGPQKVDGLFQGPQEAKAARAFQFTQAAFEPHVETDFRVRASKLVTTLRLVKVEPCAPRDGAEGECFSLLFHADGELSRVRTIHDFEHSALGEFSLFVETTQSKSDPNGLYYVAVVNHRIRRGRGPVTPQGQPARRPPAS